MRTLLTLYERAVRGHNARAAGACAQRASPPPPPDLAPPADTTEERAAQLQSALKSMSVPDFVRLCAKSAGDELDEAIFNHFSEEDFSRALLQMLAAAAEPEQPEPKAPERPSEPETRPEPVQVAEQPAEPAKQPATVKAACSVGCFKRSANPPSSVKS